MAAVARVEVQTRTESEAIGTRCVVEHGEVIEEGACSAPLGTRIAVSDLFGNVPARRKFVRSQRAEAGQITRTVAQYAMAQPTIRFVLQMDGRVTFTSPGTGRMLDAVAAVYGTGVVQHLVSFEEGEGEVRVAGVISTPALSRTNRSAIDLFVNGRPVANRSLAFALEEAYSGYLMTGKHPLAAVHLTLPPGEIDVNIHPAKSEVRFAHEREVHGALHRAVANALLEVRLQARELSGDSSTLPEEPLDVAEQGAFQLVETGAERQALAPDVPALRVFGQTNATFIIAEGPQGLYMIDQHAAHERILFDRFDESLDAGSLGTQPLLDPVSLELTPEQMLALDDNGDLLSRAGFDLEPFGDRACLIRAVPALAGRHSPGEVVVEVLTELQNSPQPGAARERALAALACKAAVKAGQTLDVSEMREIVLQLERTKRPSTCPHGRPTMIHLSHSQLEREFGRR
jgi:DNA mismatch repair protein MutL